MVVLSDMNDKRPSVSADAPLLRAIRQKQQSMVAKAIHAVGVLGSQVEQRTFLHPSHPAPVVQCCV